MNRQREKKVFLSIHAKDDSLLNRSIWRVELVCIDGEKKKRMN